MGRRVSQPKSKQRDRPASGEHVLYHRDGTLWAKGRMADGVCVGYWEWFRKDGTKLRSGYFQNGEQTGEWITYDKKGQVYKVTRIKPKAKSVKSEQKSP